MYCQKLGQTIIISALISQNSLVYRVNLFTLTNLASLEPEVI